MSKSYHRKRSGRHERPYKRAKKMTRHHIVARSQGGAGTPENILWLWRDKHTCYHRLFGNLDLDGAISLLQRVKRMKGK